MPRSASLLFKSLRIVLLAGVAATALSACAANRASMPTPDYSGLSGDQSAATLGELAARYKQRPGEKAISIHYAAALRATGQNQQAVAVLEAAIGRNGKDIDLKIAYGKALTEAGRFEQALAVIDTAILPDRPDWNALSVKGAILDQSGRNAEARQLYKQALTIAPNEASLYANIGLSYAMTNELPEAEANLRKAVQMRGANSQIRQNLALVVGLQGRFDECRAMFAAELPPAEVESNMAYIRALLTQQNRWDKIKGE